MKRLIGSLAALLLTLSAPFANAQQATPKREGVITGRVLADGQPAAGAQVRAISLGNLSSVITGGDHMTTCDGEGNFKLSGLTPGVYRIAAFSPGYVTTSDSQPPQSYRIGENAVITMVKGGVITGRVTDEFGQPMVGFPVMANKVRNADRAIAGDLHMEGQSSRETDDRGIYRIYSLNPGIYTVSLNENLLFGPPIYYPSSSRSAATELTVRSGEEVSGIDIRHRTLRGVSISGAISGDIESGDMFNAVSLSLTSVANRQVVATTVVVGSRSFAMHNVEDGEYDLEAMRISEGFNFSYSPPRRVTIRGADVSGIEMRLSNLATISGRVVIEPYSQSSKPESVCNTRAEYTAEEILLDAISDSNTPSPMSAFAQRLGSLTSFMSSTPDKAGVFTLKNVEPGRVYLKADLPSENWYVRAIIQTVEALTRASRAAAVAKMATDLSHTPIAVKQGEKLVGLEVRIAEGAATLSGKIVPSSEGGKLPKSLRIHLIPAETTASDEVLRYREVMAAADDSFEFKNLAPGKYLLHLRGSNETGRDHPVAWDSVERAKLRREAEAAKNEIELQPCQRVKDHVLRFNH